MTRPLAIDLYTGLHGWAEGLIAAGWRVIGDERRAHYDRTGETDQGPKTSVEHEALHAVMAAIEIVLAEGMQMGRMPEHSDILSMARAKLKNNLAQIEQTARNTEAEAEKVRKLARRFKPKDGKPNRIGAMFNAKAESLMSGARTCRAPVPAIKLAIEIIEEHDFDWQRPDPMSQSLQGSYLNMAQMKGGFFDMGGLR